jgi:hypothetical protein
MSDDITRHDQRKRRCPMLGHEVTFAYCRAPGKELPCRKVFDCWWEAFEVEAFLRDHLGQEQIERILAPRPAKLTSIVELIQQARRRAAR